MRVIVGCEFSQIVTKAFRNRGHEAFSCDILPTEGNPKWHIQGDILEHLDESWDLGIFHPPCDRLSNSGVRWLAERNLWEDMERGAAFFNKLLNCKIPKIAIENPIHHKYARALIKIYDQIIQPHMFGHGETKATCLWLKNLPLLTPTNEVDGRTARVHMEPPGPERWKNRSRTFQGIADAMASQWS